MKLSEAVRSLDGGIVIVDGKPLPPRHGEPTSPREFAQEPVVRI